MRAAARTSAFAHRGSITPAQVALGVTVVPLRLGGVDITDRDEVEVTHEAPRGSTADPGLLSLPGVDQVRTYLTGESPLPPVARLTGHRLVSDEPGRVVYDLPASPWFAGPNGLLHGGLLVFLADAPLYAAVQSALPARTLCTTAEMSMTFLGEPPAATGRLTAEASLIHLDHENGLSEPFIRDDTERLVAHGTSRCLVFPPFDADFDPRPEKLVGATATEDTADPWRRPLPAGGWPHC